MFVIWLFAAVLSGFLCLLYSLDTATKLFAGLTLSFGFLLTRGAVVAWLAVLMGVSINHLL